MNEREQLDKRYLEAQLREELGEPVDLSDRVLHEYFANRKPEPRRIVPPPRRRSLWKPLAAAAAVLLATGVAAYSLATWLPKQQQQERVEARDRWNERVGNEEQDGDSFERAPAPHQSPPDQEASPERPSEKPTEEEPWPDLPPEDPQPEIDPQPEPAPEEQVEEPAPEVEPETETRRPEEQEQPGPVVEPPPEIPDRYPETGPNARVLVCTEVKPEREGGVKVKRNGAGDWVEFTHDFALRSGDRFKVSGHADFVLVDGSLIRTDGEFSISKEEGGLEVDLEDGALYADTREALAVRHEELVVTIAGVAAIEQRLHAMDVFCVSGRVTGGGSVLGGGLAARFDDEGFDDRPDEIDWAKVQREFRFLKETPSRVRLRQDYDVAIERVFGGEVMHGRLKGESNPETGTGHYLIHPLETLPGDVVRIKFKLEESCELVLQFGTVDRDNWRHEMGTVKAGEWVEFELPLRELVKTTDNSQKLEPATVLKFFQLHPNEVTTGIEIEYFEIVHRP